MRGVGTLELWRGRDMESERLCRGEPPELRSERNSKHPKYELLFKKLSLGKDVTVACTSKEGD